LLKEIKSDNKTTWHSLEPMLANNGEPYFGKSKKNKTKKASEKK